MKNLQPQPWFEHQIKHQPKNNQYFHEKHDRLNSIAHSSPKIAEFYLKPLMENKKKLEISLGTFKTQENTTRSEHSRNRLCRRIHERELLQAKSSQCLSIFKTKDDGVPMFTTFKDPGSSPISNKKGNFYNYLDLPDERLKLVINEKILKMDEQALECISKKLQQEIEQEQIRRN